MHVLLLMATFDIVTGLASKQVVQSEVAGLLYAHA